MNMFKILLITIFAFMNTGCLTIIYKSAGTTLEIMNVKDEEMKTTEETNNTDNTEVFGDKSTKNEAESIENDGGLF